MLAFQLFTNQEKIKGYQNLDILEKQHKANTPGLGM
ncbi:MAG: hypothetical protein RL632_128 [Bacteroidota bacterium]|jgi:hypothetical protein